MAVINTQICPRCIGTGKHSFNLKDGEVCYGCGGTGMVTVTPKGQKKVKATCTSLYKAVKSDILEVDYILYRVEEIRWIAYRLKNEMPINQQIKVTRMVDDKTFFFKRGAVGADGCAIVTPAEWIGQEI
jgi:hypothetical protein